MLRGHTFSFGFLACHLRHLIVDAFFDRRQALSERYPRWLDLEQKPGWA
jgi:hypothetical protein